MKPRPENVALVALLIGAVAPLAAQQPAQAPDTSAKGYAPAAPAPAPPPAAAPAANAPAPTPPPAPAPAPAAAPAPAPAAAAAPAPAAAAPAAAGRTVAEALGFIDVLPARSPDRIRSELEAARSAEREADARILEASTQRSETKAKVDVKKQEGSTVDARIKLADKQKQEGEKASLEAEKKVTERQKQFLERRVALHDAELDRAKAAKRLAQADQRALDMELQLATRRSERAQVAGVDAAATLRQDEVIRELERKTLEAQRQRADASKDVASRDQDIAKRRLDLYQAQVAASGGER